MKSFFALATVCTGMWLASCGGAGSTENAAGPAADTANAVEQTLTLDTAQSSVKWKGVMLGVKEHFGTIRIKEGVVTLKNGVVTGGTVTVDMTSIVPTDANYDPKQGTTPDKLVGHLSSPDFFDVANHPTATFALGAVNGAEASGKLTVRGKENDEVIKNLAVVAGSVNHITGQLTFDRQKYGVAFMMPGKDMIISDEIVLDFSLKTR
jgi:polyisoprenoid-binding protein YceI